ncbi:hypothetical protein AcV7_004285 [Taiwanofungus camphoratus]|nr:hypothetical protein AcV7_004285 [Antrodia cinnamomea]
MALLLVGAQVWFQNRRAKTKQQAKKALAARQPSSPRSSPSPPPSPPCSPHLPDSLPNAHPNNSPAPGDMDHRRDASDETIAPADAPTPTPATADEPVSDEHANAHPSPHASNTLDTPTNASHHALASPGPVSVPHICTSPSLGRSGSAPALTTGPPVLGARAVSFSSPFAPPSSGSAPASAAVLASFELPPFAHSPSMHVHDVGQNHHPGDSPHHGLAHGHGGDLLGVPHLALRRGSLPAYTGTGAGADGGAGPPAVHRGTYDPLARRRSVHTDTHAARLTAHPYAHLAAHANGTLYEDPPSAVGRASAHAHAHTHTHAHAHVHSARRPPLVQRATQGPRASAAVDHTLAPAGTADRAYALSSRAVGAPPPGPLPASDYSFGAPPLSHVSSASASASSPASSAHPGGGGANGAAGSGSASGSGSGSGSGNAGPEEEEWTSASEQDCEYDYDYDYEALSRFGSVASVGGSESSYTSWYSEVGSAGCEEGDGRRGSCASVQILAMFGDLDVNGNPGAHSAPLQHPYQHPYSHSSPNLLHPGSDMCPQGQPHARSSTGERYHSPSSTVAGGSPHHHYHEGSGDTLGGRKRSSPAVLSHSSELAYALHSDGSGARACKEDPAIDRMELQYPSAGPSEYAGASALDAGSADIASASAADPYAAYHDPLSKPSHFPGTAAYDIATASAVPVSISVSVPVPDSSDGRTYGTYAYAGHEPGAGARPDPLYEAGAVELTRMHMCVPAIEGLQFDFGGYASTGYP